jgi:putative membrane protein
MKAQLIFISILFFALITAIFAVINVAPVQVHLVFADTELPLIVIILGSTLLGGLIAGLIGISKQFKLKRTIKMLEKQLNEAAKGHTLAPLQPPTQEVPLDNTAPEHPPIKDL